jgi:Bacterial conjugation TrbI-like protein
MNNHANDQQNMDRQHINDQQRNTEPSVAEMEDMMDFDGGHSQKTGQKSGQKTDRHNDKNAAIDAELIEDEDNNFINDEFNPEKNVTKVGFRKNGLSKFGLVGAAGLALVVGGITFFQGQAPKDKVAETPKPKDPATTQVETAQSDVTKAQQSESETKAELALSKQKDSLEQANSNKTTDPTTNKPTDSTTSKATTDPNTKVVTNPSPSVPIAVGASGAIVPPVKPSRASGFVASPVVPPLNIPSTNSTKIASTPFVPPASKNNISTPPAGVQSIPVVSAAKLATTPTETLISKKNSASPAGAGLPIPIATAPGVPKAPKPAVVETPSSKTPSKDIAKIEPTRSSPPKKRPSEDSDEPLPRLRIARAPGVSADTLPPSPPYSITKGASEAIASLPGTNSLAPQPLSSPNAIPPIAINSAPSLIDFLKTSAAADTAPQPQLIALNKEQSKEKQSVTIKSPKPVLQIVTTPGILTLANQTTTKNNGLIASNSINSKYSGLVSPNSLLTDIDDPAPTGITNFVATTDTTPSIKPALAQALPPGISSTRPAYAYTKMLLAGLSDTNMNLGNVQPVSTNQQNSQINQVNKSQVVTQNNPTLNQPIPITPDQNTPAIPGTPVSPLSPIAPPSAIGPIASSILTGTSAKGTTLTPILWGSDSANGAKFVAKLEEPLLASNKREALPAGTQLIVMAKPSNSSNNNNNSLVEVDVVGVIVQGREYATPPGAIVIHDENNGLLVGEDYFKREDQIASRDYLTVLGGALGSLGQVLNRPSGSFSSNTAFGSSSSTSVINNNNPNVFGALLEGGFKDIPGIWNQRNQQALAQLANQPKVYQIPKGRTIRVFVNQSINF